MKSREDLVMSNTDLTSDPFCSAPFKSNSEYILCNGSCADHSARFPCIIKSHKIEELVFKAIKSH